MLLVNKPQPQVWTIHTHESIEIYQAAQFYVINRMTIYAPAQTPAQLLELSESYKEDNWNLVWGAVLLFIPYLWISEIHF